MYKLLVLYPHPQSAEEFQEYYVKKHIPLASKLPGLRSSRYAFGVQGVGEASPFFCVWEGEFDSAEALGHAMASPIGQAVADDVPAYASGGAVVLHFGPLEITP